MSHYRIGDFSLLSGVSKDTLRYYDKVGVLCPSYKAENGYRYYTEYDLMQLWQIRTLRGLDSSLEECTQITAISDMSERLSAREAELDRQIDQLTNLRDRIHMLQSEIGSCLQDCGQCKQATTVPTYGILAENMTAAQQQCVAEWMQHTPYVHLSLYFTELNEAPKAQVMIGILKSYAEEHQVNVDCAEDRPARPAVRCVLRLRDPIQPAPAELAPLTDYMALHHLRPAGAWTYRIRFIDQASVTEPVYYVGACVPVVSVGNGA